MIIKGVELVNKKVVIIDLNLDKVPETRIKLIKEKLIHEHIKIIGLLKEYKDQGIIKSIYLPKNRKMKQHLKELVEAKREIKQSLKKLRIFYG